MNPSPLQLERHFFTKVQIDSNPAGKVGAANQVNCAVEIGQAADDPKRYQVTLRLKLLSSPQNDACYTGEVHAVGLFRVVDGWPPEKLPLLVEANGAALLYGAIRELLLNLTSRGPWPQQALTSVTFVQPKKMPQVAAGHELPPTPAKLA
jgi:preprotein translocase subunit SecB